MKEGQAQALITHLKHLLNKLENLEINVDSVNINLDQVENLLQGSGGSIETPDYSRVSDSAGLASGFFAVAISNVGATDGSVLGTTLPAGDTVKFSAKVGNALGAITYDATGTTFAIVTTTV